MPNAEPTNINYANSPVGWATCLPTFCGEYLVGNKLPTLRNWRAANPDKNAGQHFCTATPARRVSARDGANDLISGENSAEALLKKIKSEREGSASTKKAKKNA